MERTLPFVSIIVPVYNGSATVVRCVESLLAQDYPPDRREIIIVDNGSKDRTVELLQPYAQSGKIRLLSETRVLNAYGARNTGAKSAKGEILAFTDADCIAKGDWLSKLVKDYADENVGIFIGDIVDYQPKTVFERYHLHSLRVSDFERHGMRAGNCAIRRHCFESLGGFNSKLNSGADFEFFKRTVSQTRYTYRIALDAIVFHKNYDNVGSIFARGMRFGTSVDQFKGNPLLAERFISLKANLRAILVNLLSLLARGLAYPVVLRKNSYKGRPITDVELFLGEPLIRLAESTGWLVGRTLKLKRFR
jgi:glycosyltransferase involved in cell wall biosynthesis